MAKSRQLTPAQLARIAELKNPKKPAPVVTPDPVPATHDDIETFLKEEFPEKVPAAPVEPEPVAPEPKTVTHLALDIDTSVAPEPAAVIVTPLVANPDGTITIHRPEPIDPAAAFRAWLRTPQGLSASDPRLPEDPVRRATELEDALLLAFRAGFNLNNAALV